METEDRVESGYLVSYVSATALEILNKGATVSPAVVLRTTPSLHIYIMLL